ncbi:SAM-dependent methyltransferase [Actinomadura kijaniata]|uniref:SAM-dependent methyltransferase n=1 Tax=Actinomadura kijaniata TaxID=46161 RepID=UPI003F1AB3F6
MSQLWHYWAGGKDAMTSTTALAEQITAQFPQIDTMAAQRLAWHQRLVEFLVGEVGLGQLLIIGTDLPLHPHDLHSLAQRIVPEARIVYCDDDALVFSHARARLRGTVEGACHHLHLPLTDPGPILTEAARILEPGRPVGVIVNNLELWDDHQARRLLRGLTTGVPSGSCVAITQLTDLVHPGPVRGMAELVVQHTHTALTLRTVPQIAALLPPASVIAPGIVPCALWRPDPWEDPVAGDLWAAVARCPGPPPPTDDRRHPAARLPRR